MAEVILRVTEVRASLQYGKAGVSAEPVEDILYLIEVPEDGYKEIRGEVDKNGQPVKIFNANGMRHILKGLYVSLVIDADKESF